MNRIARRFASTSIKEWPSYQQIMTPKQFADRQHAIGTTKMWLWFNILVTAPAVVAAVIYTVPPEIEHIKHLKEHPNEWVPHPYLRKRVKDLPWGPNSLFHNKYANAVPEDE